MVASFCVLFTALGCQLYGVIFCSARRFFVVGGCIGSWMPGVGCQLLVVDWGCRLHAHFSPLLVPSSEDKNGFRQEVTSDSIILIRPQLKQQCLILIC
jgi:hypothetical protein